ncbi:uncharacterized protein [Henckelia pumila]|uniref:uncharacterized protein n=1 Tax=Henckelia pumila TaxID=405737 RepID=UPI003C6E2157
MDRKSFAQLCYLLTHVGGVRDSKYVRVEEKVAMFLSILAHHKKNRIIGHDYVRSGQTISCYFHEVLGSVLKLHSMLLVKPVPVDKTCSDVTWKWFKRYELHIALTGWEGSTADARVLRDALTREDGLKVQRGSYYLCDNGYANIPGFLTPYRRVPYHRDAWGNRTTAPQNYKELFQSTRMFELMDNGATSGSVTCKAKKLDKTWHTWTAPEEEVLLLGLKDVVTKGWKSENGFCAGYLPLLEATMKNAFPSTDIHGMPHIVSKIHVWKKYYGSLASILAKSGIGWNDTEHMIDATNEAWEALLKVDNTVRLMRYKRWPHYQDWCEIFGNDRANGDKVETYTAVAHELNMTEQLTNEVEVGMEDVYRPIFEDGAESVFVTHSPSTNPLAGTKSKQRKRKAMNDDDDEIVSALNNIANITKEAMSNLVTEIAADSKIQENIRLENAMDRVLDILQSIPELTSRDKVRVAELLVDNPKKLGLFLKLDANSRLNLSLGLLNP